MKLRMRWLDTLEQFARLLLNIAYDGYRGIRYGGLLRALENEDAYGEANLIKTAHVIEKGLCLPEPRVNFGEERIRQLCARLMEATRLTFGVNMAANALQGYVDFHKDRGATPLPCCNTALAHMKKLKPVKGPALLRLRKKDVVAQGKAGAQFLLARHSVRQFADRPVTPAEIEAAVRLAQTAPSVCNRQAGRVHAIYDRELMAKVLRYQVGNRGFGDTLGALLVVTVDLRSFLEPSERVQAWIDGGLFAMALLLGLQAQGLGSCCLNWSRNMPTDLALRRTLPLPPNESVVMFIGVGHLREEYVVARSARLPLEQVLTTVRRLKD